MKTELSRLILQFQTIYAGQPWYGDSLLQKLEPIGAETAFATPAPGVHSVAQLTAHILVWRRLLAERLKGNTGFKVEAGAEQDWLSQSALRAKGWENILSELSENQQEIVQLLSSENDALLDRLYDGKNTFRFLIEGVLQHDVYHLGQIGLVLSLKNEEKLHKKV